MSLLAQAHKEYSSNQLCDLEHVISLLRRVPVLLPVSHTNPGTTRQVPGQKVCTSLEKGLEGTGLQEQQLTKGTGMSLFYQPFQRDWCIQWLRAGCGLRSP